MKLKEFFFGRNCKDSGCYTKSLFFKFYFVVVSILAGLSLIPIYQYFTQGYFCIGCAEALKAAFFN